MLDDKKIINGITFFFKKYFLSAKKQILDELNSAGYKDIITNVSISNDLGNIIISFNDNVQLDKDQDVIELLCQGGAVKKKGTEKEFILIPGSPVLRKFLGKR